MKVVSNNFLTSWVNKGCKYAVQQINYKRRYWNGTAVVYEANWQTLTMPKAQFKSIGTLTWDMDTILDNEFKQSNATLDLLNNDYRWYPNNQSGIFGPDNVALNGYIAPGTQFQVLAGYALGGGGFELLTMFTGVLSDYDMKPEDGIFSAVVSGNEYVLTNTDAQLLVTNIVGEACAGSGKSYLTQSTGVAFIDKVYVGGALQSLTAYSIGGLDVPSFNALGPASISLVNSTSAGVTWTGRIWYSAQKIEVLVTDLLTLAGFSSSQYSVTAVNFPNGVVADFLINSYAGGLGNGTFNDTLAVNGGGAGSDYIKISPTLVIDDFESGVGGWTQNGSAWVASGGTAGAALYGTSQGASGAGYMTKPCSKATGVWMMRLSCTKTGTVNYDFMNTLQTGPGNGYRLSVTTSPAGRSFNIYTVTNVTLYRLDAGVATQLATWSPNPSGVFPGLIAHYGESTDGNIDAMMCVSVVRDATGDMALFMSNNGDNAQNVGPTCTDNTYTASSYVGLQVSWPGGSSFQPGGLVFDLFTLTTTSQTLPYASWVTTAMDAVGLTSWNSILYGSETTGTANFIFQTEVSNDGITYDAYVADPVSPGTDLFPILSAVKPYIAAQVFFMWDPTNYNSIGTGQFNSLTIGYNSSTTAIALAVCRNKNVYQMIQALAFIADYEIGFDGSGVFFFRPKSANVTSSLTFKQSDILSKIISIKPGWIEVLNDVQVTYGSSYGISRSTSYAEYNYNSLPEVRPNSYDKFLQRLDQEDVTDLLFSNDGNIALGMAQAIHDDNYRERRRITIECRLIPQLDIGDVLTISHYENPTMENNYFGDPFVTWAPVLGLSSAVALRLFKCKALQVVQDFDRQITRIVGLEILS